MKFTEFFSGKGKALNKGKNYAILFISSARVSGRDSRRQGYGRRNRYDSAAAFIRRRAAENRSVGESVRVSAYGRLRAERAYEKRVAAERQRREKRDSRAGCGGCRFASGAGASRRISAKNFRAVSRDSGFVYFFKKQRLTRTDKNNGFNGEIAQEKRRKSIKNKRKNRRNRKIFPKGIDKTHFMW